jgi:hypothetical protein
LSPHKAIKRVNSISSVKGNIRRLTGMVNKWHGIDFDDTSISVTRLR